MTRLYSGPPNGVIEIFVHGTLSRPRLPIIVCYGSKVTKMPNFWTVHDLNYSFMVLKGLFEPTLGRSNLVLDFDQSTHIKLVCSNFKFLLHEMSGIINQGNRSIVK